MQPPARSAFQDRLPLHLLHLSFQHHQMFLRNPLATADWITSHSMLSKKDAPTVLSMSYRLEQIIQLSDSLLLLPLDTRNPYAGTVNVPLAPYGCPVLVFL